MGGRASWVRGGVRPYFNAVPGVWAARRHGDHDQQGAEWVKDGDEAYAGKLQQHTQKLGEEMANGAELDQLIRAALGGLGYEF